MGFNTAALLDNLPPAPEPSTVVMAAVAYWALIGSVGTRRRRARTREAVAGRYGDNW